MGRLVSQQPLQEVLLLTVTSVRSGPSCFTASEAGHVLGSVRPLAFSPTARGPGRLFHVVSVFHAWWCFLAQSGRCFCYLFFLF